MEEPIIMSETIMIRYSGHYEEDGDKVFAVCEEAPVVGCGKTRIEAYHDVCAGIRVFLDDLKMRGEWTVALEKGTIPHFVVDVGGTAHTVKG